MIIARNTWSTYNIEYIPIPLGARALRAKGMNCPISLHSLQGRRAVNCVFRFSMFGVMCLCIFDF